MKLSFDPPLNFRGYEEGYSNDPKMAAILLVHNAEQFLI